MVFARGHAQFKFVGVHTNVRSQRNDKQKATPKSRYLVDKEHVQLIYVAGKQLHIVVSCRVRRGHIPWSR